MNKYSVIFWNIGLSPPARDGKENKSYEDKLPYIDIFLNYVLLEKTFDIIFLVEVKNEDFKIFEDFISDKTLPYKILDGTNSVGEKRFDSCCIYRQDKLYSVSSPQPYTMSKGNHKHKVAMLYDFIPTSSLGVIPKNRVLSKRKLIELSNKGIQFYICHWPSDAHSSGRERRELIAQTLSNEIITDHKIRNFIVLGDFNTSPYDNLMTKTMNGLRCEATVLRHGKDDADIMYLFNPSWKFLWSHVDHCSDGIDTAIPDGTYYYANGSSERWFVYDQVLFPYTFLTKDKPWSFDKNSLKLVKLDLISSKTWRKAKFDHLPFSFEICEYAK